jgi:acyl carrier protein
MHSRMELEELVAALWQTELKVDTIGASDNFIDLGGHSLAAMRIAARLRESLGVDIPVSVVLSDVTFREFIDNIRASCAAQ